MNQEEKVKYSIGIVKFVIYLITLIIGILAAYKFPGQKIISNRNRNAIQSRHRKTIEKLDMVKVEIKDNKIETEIRKIRNQKK